MSLTMTKFRESAKTISMALLTATFFAANANAATVEELTCYTKDADIKATQSRLLESGMIPVTSHFKNVGTDQAPKWGMATLMMNPQTKKGYEWARMPAGHVCLSKSYSNVELYANNRLDPKSFVDKRSAPFANDRGDGSNISTVGINTSLLIEEQSQQYPMYRANVEDIINLDKRQIKTPTKYIEYLVGNPSTKEGTILAANFNGKRIAEYTNVVGTPSANGVKFGAIFTPAGEELLSRTVAISPLPTPPYGVTTSVAVAAFDKK